MTYNAPTLAPQDGDSIIYAPLFAVRCGFPLRNPAKDSWLRQDVQGGKVFYSLAVCGKLGCPYGVNLRLLLMAVATLATLAKRDGGRVLHLGKPATLARRAGVSIGGRTMADFKTQAHRLFSATITITKTSMDDDGNQTTETVSFCLSAEPERWAAGEWCESITLSDAAHAALRDVVPLPAKTVTEANNKDSKSPLTLDLLAWLSWRAHRVTKAGKPARVAWDDLYGQFGAAYDKAKTPSWQQQFRAQVRRCLETIGGLWNDAKVDAFDSMLVIQPSPALVPARQDAAKPRRDRKTWQRPASAVEELQRKAQAQPDVTAENLGISAGMAARLRKRTTAERDFKFS